MCASLCGAGARRLGLLLLLHTHTYTYTYQYFSRFHYITPKEKRDQTHLSLTLTSDIRVHIRLLHPTIAPAPGGDAGKVDAEGLGEVADGGGCEDVFGFCCVRGVEAWGGEG